MFADWTEKKKGGGEGTVMELAGQGSPKDTEGLELDCTEEGKPYTAIGSCNLGRIPLFL